MFQRIRNFLSRRSTSPRRDIFSYFDGQQQRRLDPWAALLDLWTDPEHDYGLVIKGCQTKHEKHQAESQRSLEAMVRRVFDIPAFDGKTGRGLTLLELHALHGQFAAYIGELKKKLGISLTPSPPTDSGSSANSTTPPESDCCCMPNASTSAAPTSSCEPCSNPTPENSPDPSGTTPSL